MKKSDAVIIYSGGMDSFTLLHEAIQSGRFENIYALSFNYGQRHSIELLYASKVCGELAIPHKIIDMHQIGEQLLGGSALTSKHVAVPHGHYEDETMRATVVPNRNMIMLSMALGYSISVGAKTVLYGAHAGDHAIYPDCREEFLGAMQEAAKLCHYTPLTVLAPYQGMDKIGILAYGLKWGLNYEDTWTCYDPQLDSPVQHPLACGKCGSCQERLEAFEQNRATDPLEYV